MSAEWIGQFDAFIRRDPARRGLISSEAEFGPLCPGHLAEAAVDLAEHGTAVAIVTGFFVPGGEIPAAETDGPLGALVLAATMRACGIDAFVLTDRHCGGAVAAAAESVGFPTTGLCDVPDDVDGWLDAFFAGNSGRSISHLISVERVGPNHTGESLQRQNGHQSDDTDRFLESVPLESQDRCHNMRGEIIDETTPPLHRLFEVLHQHRPGAKTIGIGDGANEIGMGSVNWRNLVDRLQGKHAPRIPCRVATDWNIVAGTSNWGAYALAAVVAMLRGRAAELKPWGVAHQQAMLEHVVERGPAVDGKTRRRAATVDGLPFATYIQPWQEMRRLMGLEES